MKAVLLAIGLILVIGTEAQVKIFAHNDYAKPEPLVNAIRFQADYIEADVFPGKEKLYVAHHKYEIDSSVTLDNLYIQPIVAMMKEFPDSIKGKSLVIDIKEKGEETINMIIRQLNPYRQYFDRSMNKNAVQVIISGDRGEVNKWLDYPAFIYFDGRPYEQYSADQLSKVALISDSYYRYVSTSNPSDKSGLNAVIRQVHQANKPVRFWATPDTEKCWKSLIAMGVDVMNTDQVENCRKVVGPGR